MTNILLSAITVNPANPRKIDVKEFTRLKKSIQNDPELLTVRPLVLNTETDYMLLAGEQRYKALIALGYTEIPSKWVLFADELSEEQKQKFILLDNDHAGSWDIEKLTTGWDIKLVTDLEIKIPGLDVAMPELLKIDDVPAAKERQAPSATHNDYSVFELVMLHSNKVKLLNVLNQVKGDNSFEKLEDSLMHIVNSFSE